MLIVSTYCDISTRYFPRIKDLPKDENTLHPGLGPTLHFGAHFLEVELGSSASFGRAGAVGMLQAILQAMLQGAGPVGCCPKVLRGILLAGRFVPGSSFLAFLAFLVIGCCAFKSSWPLDFWQSRNGRRLPRLPCGLFTSCGYFKGVS